MFSCVNTPKLFFSKKSGSGKGFGHIDVGFGAGHVFLPGDGAVAEMQVELQRWLAGGQEDLPGAQPGGFDYTALDGKYITDILNRLEKPEVAQRLAAAGFAW